MNKRLIFLFSFLMIFAFAESGAARIGEVQSSHGLALPAKPLSPAARMDFGKMPVYFVENRGQVDERVAYYVQGKDKSLYFTESGVTFVLNGEKPNRTAGGAASIRDTRSDELNNPSERQVVKLDFVGARPGVRPGGEEKAAAVISYFKGDFEDWHTGLPTYGRIVYRDLWLGIDLAYSGTSDRLKYEFVVRPGADPALIRLAYRGATSVDVSSEGRLDVRTPQGGFSDDVPVACQDVSTGRRDVAVRYELSAAGEGRCEYGFRLGDYDRSRTLVIDPAVLIFCGYVGGSGIDEGFGVALDGSGNVYITGATDSAEATFPETAGPDLTYNKNTDAFVAKIDPSGSSLVYCGYIGGSDVDRGYGIAVDGSGNAFITGSTQSSEATFPETDGPDTSYNGGGDAFVAKVKPSGTGLDYCGYIGGAGTDIGYGIAVGSSGTAYVTGSTSSTAATFPEAVGPSLKFGGWVDAFVARVQASGAALVACGYIGGSDSDEGRAIALDTNGNVFVTGLTYSSDATFPVVGGPDLIYNGSGDAFVARVKASFAGLDYCGYIGGSGLDSGYGIAVSDAGNTFVTGETASSEATFCEFGGPDVTYNGGGDAFVAKLKVSGLGFDYCGYIGGAGLDGGQGIAVDGAGNVYIAGGTLSSEATFPVSGGPDLTFNGGKGGDAFVAKVKSTGASLDYCGYIGGDATDYGMGIALDGSGNAYVAGYAYSTETTFPERLGPDLTNNGSADAFVAKVSEVASLPAIGLSHPTLNFGALAGGAVTKNQFVLVSNTGGGILSWTAADNQAWLNVTPASGSGNGQLQVSVNPAGLSAGLTEGAYQGTITVSDEFASNSPQTITVNLKVYAAGTNSVPFGDFATPISGTTGITGAIPVTGWVLDDIETVSVQVKRAPHATDPSGAIGPDGLVYIGDGLFVEGARPDVEAGYPTHPLNYRAGWGYMLLTNFLPLQGNDTFTLHAIATDKEGNVVSLGTKVITCDNAHAVKPFGTIDTPIQGGIVSGNPYLNFGWVLTPLPKTVPKNGSTIEVYVDSVKLGDLSTAPNVYDQFRPDVSGSFPGLNNSNGPVGAFYLNAEAYADGVHTIFWIATDDQGAADGIGSRYFTKVSGVGDSISKAPAPGLKDSEIRSSARAAVVPAESIANLPLSFNPLSLRRGFDSAPPAEPLDPDSLGVFHIGMREVERIELSFGSGTVYRGYVRVGNGLRPLPIGSTLDTDKGTFLWLPGPGFLGAYDLVFLSKDEFGLTRRIPVEVAIKPKY